MIIPLIGFMLFILGKFIRMTNDLLGKWQLEGFSTMYRAIYLHITLYFLAHILLHFFLASYEYFFYRSYNDFRTLANSVLKGRFPKKKSFLQRTEECALVMEYFHRAFGLFLLVRRTLRKLITKKLKFLYCQRIMFLQTSSLKDMNESRLSQVNLTLMLLFWLVHIYMAYFTFQV